MVPMLENGVALSVNRRICRQVLDCGDGVREVTALALATLKIRKLAADSDTATQSGDSEDSVAAVQDARAPIRSALGFWSPFDVRGPWRLSMKRTCVSIHIHKFVRAQQNLGILLPSR